MAWPILWLLLTIAHFVDPQQTTAGECCSDDQNTEVAENEVQEVELAAACPELSEQIIGGRPSSITRHPYQVSMVMNGNSFCGGFIISRDYVLTAAHCVQNTAPEAIRLRVGSTRRDSGGRIVSVSAVTVHPQYGQPQFDHDIAALRLSQPLVFGPAIQPIRLPRPRQAVPLVRLTVTGWGLTAPGGRRIPRTMMEANVPVVPHWLCRLSYGDSLTRNMFCGGHFLIGGVSSCQGDSGGPAVFRGTAFGVVSFARGCALPLSPTVFSNIASLRDWVTQTTGV
ncbi:trypsin-like [Vanessa tameamea]|uniref:Trypsin-like n=1 Tax=Vanessa tameamea TaxID=334116 RepID=A0A8B8I3B8_VANTA|nr:trypsin-like [Vanessa tameamea]XP_026491490.1 trypsin-like [Vanessa tameamea]